MDNSYPAAFNKKVFGAEAKTKWADLIKRTEAIQVGGKVKIWTIIDGVFPEKMSSPDKSPIWVIDLMRVRDGKLVYVGGVQVDCKIGVGTVIEYALYW